MSFPTEVFKNSIDFIFSDYYNQWKPILIQLLIDSRNPSVYQCPNKCLNLQLHVLEYLSHIEQEIENQKNTNSDYSNIKVVSLQRIRRIIKDIIDGLVWRILDFNRPLISALSYNNSPGHLKNLTSNEEKAAIKLVNSGYYVIINDLSNYLRIGDLTCFDSQGNLEIREVKKKGQKILGINDYHNKVIHGGTLSKQSQKLIEANNIIKTNNILMGNEITPIIPLDIKLQSYIPIVSEIVKNCQNQGEISRFIDDVLYVKVINVNLLKNEISNPLQNKENWFYQYGIFYLYYPKGEINRHKVPFSAFPFNNDFVLQLITGELLIDTAINTLKLKRLFEKQGWDVKYNNNFILEANEYVKLNSNPLFRNANI